MPKIDWKSSALKVLKQPVRINMVASELRQFVLGRLHKLAGKVQDLLVRGAPPVGIEKEVAMSTSGHEWDMTKIESELECSISAGEKDKLDIWCASNDGSKNEAMHDMQAFAGARDDWGRTCGMILFNEPLGVLSLQVG